MKQLIIASILLLLTVLNVACSSLPTLKDFNKISVGMTKKQVIEELGEPKTTKALDGREVMVYDAKDGDEEKPRWVVLEDKEVIFYGRPGEYEGKINRSPSGAANTVTVSPNINPVISPIFNINGSPASTNVPQIQSGDGERLLWFHANPGNEKKE